MPPSALDRARAPARRWARLRWAAAGLLATASAAAQDEVPFITTPDNITVAMLELAGVSASDHVIDLGSGDGRIVITAARRFGASGLGVEIVPELVRKSRENARAAGVSARAEFREQDLFATDLARATVVTMYLLPEVNLQLRPRLLALAAGTRIVSHDWDLGDWQPDRSLTLAAPDKSIGREKISRVMLWVVPASLQGTWCAADGLQLRVQQRFQRFSATLEQRGAPAPVAVFDGQINGNAAIADRQLTTQARLRLDQATLKLESASHAAAAYAGRAFERTPGPACAN